MYNFLSKNGQLVAFGLGVVLVVIFLAIAVSGAGDYYFDTMDDADIYRVDIFNFGILIAIVLTILCAVGIVLFGVYHVASNPKESMTGIIGILAIAGLFALFYSMSAGTIDHPTLERSIEKILESGGEALSSSTLKWVGGGIKMGVVMAILAFVAMLVMPLISPIINRAK